MHNANESNSRLWSDFDGTAVAIAPTLSLANWLKYPLPVLPGYIDFLKGVRQSGVEIAGIVTARPSIRRWATTRSIAKLGLGEFFDAEKVHFARSHAGKGIFLAEQSRLGRVAMVEDMPHKLGPILVGAMHASADERPHYPVTLGVVEHAKSASYTEELLDRVEKLQVANCVSEPANGEAIVEGDNYSLRVVQLPAYSELTGKKLAQVTEA